MENITQTIEGTRNEQYAGVIGACHSLLKGNATHLTMNIDATLFKEEGMVKLATDETRFTRLQCVNAINMMRRRAIDHGSTKYPLMSKLMPELEDAEKQALVAASRVMAVKGKVHRLMNLGLTVYFANIKKRKQEDARFLAKQTAQEVGIAFRVLRRDGTAILNAHDSDSEFHYDMDAAIKSWCRDTYGSNWYVFGQTAQNESRKAEAVEFIEVISL